jgi:peptide/nickel transport system substrate-binding protein
MVRSFAVQLYAPITEQGSGQMKRWAWRALLVCGALLLAACGPVGNNSSSGGSNAPASGALRNGGTLTVALADDPDALDPTLARTLVGRMVFTAMCEKLYDINNSLQVVPQLAASLPTTAPDGKTVTIKLRQGVKFNDGTNFDAAAVKKSLDRHRTLTGSQRQSELLAVGSVDVVDPSTVRINLKQPFSPLASVLADRSGMVMSPAQLDKLGDKFGTNPVCVGPFKFSSRVAQDRIELVKSDQYYDKAKVHLDKLIFKPIPDDNIRLANLRSGDVQVADQIQPSDVASVRSDSNLQLITAGSLGYQGISINLNNTKGLFPAPTGKVPGALAGDPRVRRAFELSLDREALNKVVFNGLYEPTCSPIPLNSPFATPALSQCPPHDPNQAKTLLSQAGVKTPVPVELMTDNSPLQARIGQAIQSMAKEGGFAVKLRPVEFATSLDESDAGHYQAYLVGWSGRVDPDGNISNFQLTQGSQNISRASDKAIDDMIIQARSTNDVNQRKQLYGQIIKATQERDSIIYVYRLKTFIGASKKVGGVTVFADSLIRAAFAGNTAS